MFPPSGLMQLNSLTGPPVEVQLRTNSGSSASGPEVSVNAAVQSTVTVPTEDGRQSLHKLSHLRISNLRTCILYNYTVSHVLNTSLLMPLAFELVGTL